MRLDAAKAIYAGATPVKAVYARGEQVWPPAASGPPTPAGAVGVWWAGDLTLDDADPVGAWVDRVNGHSLTASETARPTFDVDGANGRPSVNFDGSNDVLSITSALGSESEGCVVAVARLASPNAGQTLWSAGWSNAGTHYVLGTTTFGGGQVESQQRANDVNDVVRGSAAVAANTLAILEWASNGTVYAHRLNNAVGSMTAVQGANNGDWFGDTANINRWAIGALIRSGLAGFFNGRIAYLGRFNQPLSIDDRAALYGWLADYYEISL